MDALSEVFAAVRFSGGVFLNAEFTAPWCVVSQVSPEEFGEHGRMPAHLIAYHYIIAGRMLVGVGDAPPLEACAGEIVLLPRNDGHVLGSAAGLRPAVIDDRVEAPTDQAPATLRYGGGGEPTHIVCGYIGCEVPQNPLLTTLPTVLKLGVRDGTGGEWIESSFRRAAEEFAHSGVGSAAVLGKLAELLFVDVVRRYLASLPEGQTGWLAGLRDRMVGRALALLHARCNHPWDNRGTGARSGAVTVGVCRTFHRPDRHAADALPDHLAAATGRRAPARKRDVNGTTGQRRRLRIGRRLQPGLQARLRNNTGGLAPKSVTAVTAPQPIRSRKGQLTAPMKPAFYNAGA